MDLDDEELKATRIMNGSLELSADEMFKKLGYKKIRDGIDCWCIYENDIHKISFEKNVQSIFFEDKKDVMVLIKPDVLKAIIKKCKEMGWI